MLEKVSPDHPTEALVARRGGVVILRVLIREDGGVGEVCVVAVEPPGYGFEEAAVQAIHRWRFDPAIVDGMAVPAYSIYYMSWAIISP